MNTKILIWITAVLLLTAIILVWITNEDIPHTIIENTNTWVTTETWTTETIVENWTDELENITGSGELSQ